MDYLERIASHVEAGQHSDMGDLIDMALREGIAARDIVDKGIVAGIERPGAEMEAW